MNAQRCGVCNTHVRFNVAGMLFCPRCQRDRFLNDVGQIVLGDGRDSLERHVVPGEGSGLEYECMNCGELVNPLWANKCCDELGETCRP